MMAMDCGGCGYHTITHTELSAMNMCTHIAVTSHEKNCMNITWRDLPVHFLRLHVAMVPKTLVGNVMSPRCWQCWLKISWWHHVADIVTRFIAGSCVNWHVAVWLPSHVHNLWDHYSYGDKSYFWRKTGIFMYISAYITLLELSCTE